PRASSKGPIIAGVVVVALVLVAVVAGIAHSASGGGSATTSTTGAPPATTTSGGQDPIEATLDALDKTPPAERLDPATLQGVLGAGLGQATGPARVVALVDDLAKRFPWSPALVDARKRAAAADAEAPRVELRTDPAGATVTVDGRAITGSPLAVRLTRGEHAL